MSNPEVSDPPPPTEAADDATTLAAAVFNTDGAVPAPVAAQLPVWQSRPRRGWRTWLSMVGTLLVWCVVFALGALALLRIFYHDGNYPLTCINAFTAYVYLPAYAVLAWAVWRRRWILATAGALVVACHLAWIGPDLISLARSAPTPPATTAASPTLRVFVANVRATNTEYPALLDEIAAAEPDVIVLVEFSREWRLALDDAPVLKPYIYRPTRLAYGRIACYSRVPITEIENVLVTNRICRILTLQVGEDRVRLFCLHAPRPMDYPWYDYAGYWKTAVPLMLQQPGPLVVVGDFNATQHSDVYEQLTAAHLRSAHEDRQRGYVTTWPNGESWVPPIRIDHVLLSPDVECLDITEGLGAGSDHKPVVFDVRVRDDPPGGVSAVSNEPAETALQPATSPVGEASK